MEEEGEKERKKEKPGVILASKRKRQKVKSVLGGGFWGALCAHEHSKPLLLTSFLVTVGFW